MSVAVAGLMTWTITAALGLFMVAMWIRQGGLGRRSSRPGVAMDVPPPYFPAPLVLGHFVLAALGLLVWVAYVLERFGALAWIAFGTLMPVALLGYSMLGRWFGSRRMRRAIANPGTRPAPAESVIPAAVVVVHGMFGGTTIVLVLAAALGVGPA
jgi:hypothetical protein